MNKKIAVITDNDSVMERILYSISFNKANTNQHIFMGKTEEEWTWEKCIYDCNKESLENIIQITENAQYFFHGKDYGQYLGKMLNNKAEIAYQMLNSGIEFNIPEYIKEAINWLNE